MAICTAHLTRTGAPCRRYAVRGATVCPTHGGRAPQVKAAARGRLAEQRAIRSLEGLGYTPVEDPFAELADLAGRAIALERFAERQVAELGAALTTTDKLGNEEVRAALRLLERSLGQAAKLVEACAKLDVAQRQVRIDEQKAAILVRLLSEAFRQLAVAPQLQADVFGVLKALVAEELARDPKVIEGGTA